MPVSKEPIRIKITLITDKEMQEQDNVLERHGWRLDKVEESWTLLNNVGKQVMHWKFPSKVLLRTALKRLWIFTTTMQS